MATFTDSDASDPADTHHATGTAVFFWGAQWTQNNPLSGGAAPSSFKGFEDSTTRPACGTPGARRPDLG